MSLCDQTIPYVEICSFPEVGESFGSRCRGTVSGIPGFVRSVHAARDYWRFFGAGAARFFVHRTVLRSRCLCQRVLGHDHNAVEGYMLQLCKRLRR